MPNTHTSSSPTRRPLLVAILAFCAAAVSLPAHAWTWKLDNNVYQELNVFARDQYKKAESAFEAQNYKLAANEFKRYTLEFGDTPAVSAAAFMHAHSVMQDKKRYEAIKLYQEVVDFFPDDSSYAPAAQYYIGRAYIDSGDLRKGLKELEKLVEDERYAGHDLVGSALQALAENYRKNEDWSKYFKYGTQIHRDYWSSNRRLADNMRHDLTRWYLKDARFKSIEELNSIHVYKDGKANPVYWHYVWDRAYNDTFRNYRDAYYSQKEEPDRQEAIDKFWKYWTSGKSVIVEHSKWEWDRRSLEFLLRYRNKEKALWEPFLADIIDAKSDDGKVRHVVGLLMNYGMLDEARELFPRVKDEQGFYVWYSEQLINKGHMEEAEHVIGKIGEPGIRNWRLYQWHYRKNNWVDCIKVLEEIVANDSARSTAANWALATIYRERTKQYDEAIKIYQALGEPPRTTFLIADAFKRWGKQRQAAESYTEIENFFPGHAAEAAWQRAQMWHQFGDKDKAIADYRRILKVYKGSSQASKSHVELEKLGIETGGGALKQ